MKKVDRHVIIFSIMMLVIGIGLICTVLLITKKYGPDKEDAKKIEIEKLCIINNGVKKKEWEYITLHHSATDEGNASNFDRYHKEIRKWTHGLAYHFVIGNGKGAEDGEIEVGKRWKMQIHGAHTANMDLNKKSIGICLVGNFEEDNNKLTDKQLDSLVNLVNYLTIRFKIPKSNITKHNQVVQKSTACPGKNFPYQELMNRIY